MAKPAEWVWFIVSRGWGGKGLGVPFDPTLYLTSLCPDCGERVNVDDPGWGKFDALYGKNDLTDAAARAHGCSPDAFDNFDALSYREHYGTRALARKFGIPE